MTILTSKCKHCQSIGRSALDKTELDSFFCVLDFLGGAARGDCVLFSFKSCLRLWHYNGLVFLIFHQAMSFKILKKLARKPESCVLVFFFFSVLFVPNTV